MEPMEPMEPNPNSSATASAIAKPKPNRMFRCKGCDSHGPNGHEFCGDPDTAKCKCGHTVKELQAAGVLYELTVVHFDPPGKFPGKGLGFLACQPAVKVGTGGHRATGLHKAVNCPACIASAAFNQSEPGDPMLDVPVPAQNNELPAIPAI